MRNIFATLMTIESITILIAVCFFITLCIIKRIGITYYIKELIAMYSNTDSFFSKKRFESGILFLCALLILLSYDYIHRYSISHYEMISQFFIMMGAAGYVLDKIQKEKQDAPKV